MEIRFCKICQKYLPANDFGNYKRNNKPRKFSYCKICDSNRVKKNQKDNKLFAVSYKGNKCERCGYDKCLGSLHFHHKNPFEKDFGISEFKKIDRKKLIEELDKCILLCANCHGEIHEEIDKMHL